MALRWLCRAVGDFFQRAKGFVDRLRIREGIQKIGCDQNNVGTLLHALEVLAAYSLAEVKRRPRGEGIKFASFLHIVLPRLNSGHASTQNHSYFLLYLANETQHLVVRCAKLSGLREHGLPRIERFQ
jgi:hypothetical protein